MTALALHGYPAVTDTATGRIYPVLQQRVLRLMAL